MTAQLPENPYDPKWIEASAKQILLPFHQARAMGIGGTDISAIIGENPWKTEFTVWLEKTSQAPAQVESKAMKFGMLLEPVVIKAFAEETGKQVARNRQSVFQSKEHPIAVGTPDGWVMDDDAKEIVEAKTATRSTAEWGDPGTDQVPTQYLCQCQWYAKIMGADVVHLPVLISGSDFRIYRIESNPTLQGMMVERAEKFWRDYVLANKPPPIETVDDQTKAWIKEKYPFNNGTLSNVDEDAYSIVMLCELRDNSEKLDHLVELVDSLKARLKIKIGEHDGIECRLGKITWKKSKDRPEVDVEKAAAFLINKLRENNPQIDQVWADAMKQATIEIKGSRRFLTYWKEGKKA